MKIYPRPLTLSTWIALAVLGLAVDAPAETATEMWIKHFNPGTGTDFPIGVAMDSSANVFTCGVQSPGNGSKGFITKYAAADGAVVWSISPNAIADIPVSAANGDVIVVSTVSNGPLTVTRYAGNDGHLVWQTAGPNSTEPIAMKLDTAGNVVFSGRLENDLGFDGDRPYPIHNYYTSKYSGADGHLIWEKQYNGPQNYDDIPAALALDGSGNVVVTGESQDNVGRPEIYTVKYDGTDGHVLWERRYNGPNVNNYDRGRGVTVDGSGDVLVTGQADDDKLYLAKYAGTDGHVVWEKIIPYPGGGTLRGNDVVADARGNVIVACYAAVNSTKFYVGKYRSSDGALIWQTLYLPASGTGGAELHRLALDAAGNIVTSGSFTVGNTDRNDAYLGKLSNADGAVIWEKTYDSAAHLDEVDAERKPFEIAPDGSIALAVGSSLGGQDWESVTIKYSVEGAAGGARLLWSAGRDLAQNEAPNDAAETAATNSDVPQWSYGYRTSAVGTALTLFTPAEHVNDPSGLQGWIAPGQATLGVNTTDHSITFNTGSGNYKPLVSGQIYLSPGSGGEYLVTRWTAPEAGDYRVLARWVDLDNHGGDGAGAELVVNGEILFAEAFEATPTATHRARLRAQLLRLNAGDTVDFVLAPRGTPTFDATAFNAIIRRVPKVMITSPASGSELTGDITFTVDVQHNSPIRSIFLFFDDQSVGIGNTNNPYAIKAAPKPGYHKVRAVVTDEGGAEVESPEIAFIVKEPSASQSATKAPAGPHQPGAFNRLCRTVQSGNWNNSSTWLNGITPHEFDDAIIEAGHHVVIDFADSPRDLIINGTLSPSANDQKGIDVKRTCYVNGTVEGLDGLTINTGGRLIVARSGAAIRNSVVNNYGRAIINATDFDAAGSRIFNWGTMKVKPPIGSQGPLLFGPSEYEQRGGSTALGTNCLLTAPDGLRFLHGGLELTLGYTPLIGNDSNTLIGIDANSMIGDGGATLIGDGGATMIGDGGSTIIGDAGATLVSENGLGLIGDASSTLIGPDALRLIGMDSATLIGNAGGTIQPTSAESPQTPDNTPIIFGPGTTITGTGEIRGDVVNQGALIAPGQSPGGLVVIGNYTQEAGGTLVLELGGNTFVDSFSYDIFQVSGTANLGGNLVVKTINSYTPASGETVPAILYGNHTGNFASVTSNAQVSLSANGAQVTTNGTNPPGPRALNISTRLQIQAGDNALFAGFIVTGPAGSTKKVLIRGIGPSLAQFGVSGTIPDPLLELHTSGGTITNDDWQQAPNANEIPDGFAPAHPKESVIIATLAPGNYSAILKGAHGETGVGLAEVYDLEPNSAAQLANIATRGLVQTGDNVLIGGFIVAGDQPAKMLVRAIGPSLSAFGVQGALQDTTLELHDSNGGVISNDNWKETDGAAIYATTIPPSHDNEAAILATLAPGNYTAVVRGANDTTGIAVVEAYNLQ